MAHPRIRRSRALDDALHGALAGLIGGAALIVAQQIVMPRLAGSRRPVRTQWDARVTAALERLGWSIPREARAGVSVATQLLYAALLGASYGIARRPLRRSAAGQRFLDAGLMLGASLFSAEAPRVRRRRRGQRGRIERLAREQFVGALSAPALYQRATAIALDRLAGRTPGRVG